ncbi:MAG: hypothetical protein KatS3mg008_0959 [Acidimicrobiales bacterium]|nr:MAG: hypothetical protein KatS3mg008_0959 [Acidimicrobiales bacterium]
MTQEVALPLFVAFLCVAVTFLVMVLDRRRRDGSASRTTAGSGRTHGVATSLGSAGRGDDTSSTNPSAALARWIDAEADHLRAWLGDFEERVAGLEGLEDRANEALALLEHFEGDAGDSLRRAIEACPDEGLRAELEGARASALTALRLVSQRRPVDAAAALARYRDLRDRVLHGLDTPGRPA